MAPARMARGYGMWVDTFRLAAVRGLVGSKLSGCRFRKSAMEPASHSSKQHTIKAMKAHPGAGTLQSLRCLGLVNLQLFRYMHYPIDHTQPSA